jgi:hypothetical protein
MNAFFPYIIGYDSMAPIESEQNETHRLDCALMFTIHKLY